MKVTVKRHANRATKEEIARLQRNMQARIKRCRRNKMPVLIQDEAVFVADAKPRRVHAPPDVRAVTCVAGTRERTIVYGVPGLNGEQLFCRYDKFDADRFRVPQGDKEAVHPGARHNGQGAAAQGPRSEKGPQEDGRHADSLPSLGHAGTGCRRRVLEAVKGELLRVSCITMGNLRDAITDCFENKTFNLDACRYMMRSL